MKRDPQDPGRPQPTPSSGSMERALFVELADLRARVVALEDELADKGNAGERRLAEEAIAVAKMAGGMTAEASSPLLAASASLELAQEALASTRNSPPPVELVDEALASVRRAITFLTDVRRLVARHSTPAGGELSRVLRALLAVTGVVADRTLELRYDLAPNLPEVKGTDVLFGRCISEVLGRASIRRAPHERRAIVTLRALRAPRGVRLDIEPENTSALVGAASALDAYTEPLARKGVELSLGDLPRSVSFLLPVPNYVPEPAS